MVLLVFNVFPRQESFHRIPLLQCGSVDLFYSLNLYHFERKHTAYGVRYGLQLGQLVCKGVYRQSLQHLCVRPLLTIPSSQSVR